MKRLISSSASEINKMDASQLKQAIFASEGRTIVAETVVTSPPLIQGLSNPEVMATFGADVIVLNELDVFNPEIPGLEEFSGSKGIIQELKRLDRKSV